MEEFEIERRDIPSSGRLPIAWQWYPTLPGPTYQKDEEPGVIAKEESIHPSMCI
jgi:hypothetical protein